MYKRPFDIFFAVTGLLLTGWAIILLFIITCIDTGRSGIFMQKRIGQYGVPFTIYKLRSIANITPDGTWQLTHWGRILRKYKLDELPQFINILIGNMSAVGPRPDVPGYYNMLRGEDRKVLELKPGLTGPSNLKYWNEEYLLADQPNPLKYNDEVLFPDKIKINLCYLKKKSLLGDIKLIAFTIIRKSFSDDYFNC